MRFNKVLVSRAGLRCLRCPEELGSWRHHPWEFLCSWDFLLRAADNVVAENDIHKYISKKRQARLLESPYWQVHSPARPGQAL